MAMSPDFAISYPLRFIVTNSKSDDPQNARIYCLDVGGQTCIALFSDVDSLERHENPIAGKSIQLISSSTEFLETLGILAEMAVDGVVFDPGRIGRSEPFVYSINELGRSIGRQ